MHQFFLIVKILFSFILVLLSSGFNIAYAEGNSFITIVNPVRISSYTLDPLESIKAEYKEVKDRNLPATWLLTYDVMLNDSILRLVNSFNQEQEIGIFLEITENFSKASEVSYNKSSSWHHANALFLTGYKQEDRKKLIDKVFSEFKNKFGYYPKSVGGWWVDSFSLLYMEERYGITGVLGISDQFDLDNYQVWGTPYSTPFYPSKLHAAIPGSGSNKVDVVSFRWAARDPLNGYISPSRKQASLYSVQDYSQIGGDIEYFEKLLSLYSVQNNYNRFGHITIGLEADYSPDIYESIFSKHLDSIKKFENQGTRVLTMQEFSKWYSEEFPKEMPYHFIETNDLMGSQNKIMWYQNSIYRIGLIYDYISKKTKIADLRGYFNNFEEPFYYSPNKQYNLSINLPFVIDSVNSPTSVWDMNLGSMNSVNREKESIKVQFEKGSISFDKGEIYIAGVNKIPDRLKNSSLISVKYDDNGISLSPKTEFRIPAQGLVFSNPSLSIPFTIKYRLEQYKLLVSSVLFGLGLLFIRVLRKRKIILLYFSIVLLLLIASVLIYKLNIKYYISQTEADGLSVLSMLPKGKVLVYDKDCLRCKFEIRHRPAAAGGIKAYVRRLSGQETVTDFSFSVAKTSKDAIKMLRSKDIDYVYLVKYEDYIEYLPYLPQDLGLEKLYSNANVEIFKVN